MTLRRSVFLALLVLSTLLTAVWGIQAESKDGLLAGLPCFKVADPRVGIASRTEANADNLMIGCGRTVEDPLARIERGRRFRLSTSYEAVFFPTAAGSARFELEVYRLRTNGERVLIGSDQTMITGTGPRRTRGSLNVYVALHDPGIYRLAIVSRSTAHASGGSPIVDEDEIIVYVIVPGDPSGVEPESVTPMPADDEPTRLPPVEREPTRRPVMPRRLRAKGLASGLQPTRTPWPTATPRPTATPPPFPEPITPVPTDRELRVASPRGHFVSSSVGAAENFCQNHGRVLVVRQGDSVTFKSAYEFVWFEGASGIGQTELSIHIDSGREDSLPVGGDRAEFGERGAWRLAGTLQAEVPFNEPGSYDVVATIRTRVDPAGRNPQTVMEDEDRVRVRVIVLGQPQVGAVSGTVTEADNDVPLERVAIRVYDAETGRLRKTVYTSSDGSYRAAGLEPGEYLVQADPLAQNYLAEWYDDSPTREGADPVCVVAYRTTSGIDFGLTPGAVISGQVIGDNPNSTSPAPTPIPDVIVIAGRYDDSTMVAKTVTLDDGTYRLDKLEAGSYWVWAGNAAKSLIGEYYDDHLRRDDADPVEVPEGDEVTDIDFALRYGGSISGRVVGVSVSAELVPFKVTAYDWETGEAVRTVSVGPRGVYLIPSLPVGQYRVYAFDEAGRYIPEYYDDATDPDEATPVVVRRGQVTRGIDFELAPAGVATLEIRPVVTHVKPGDTFSVSVEVKEVMDLGAFSLGLSFSPHIVEALGVELGEFLGSTGRRVVEVGPMIDNDSGTVTYGAVSFGEQEGPNGSGLLATITFRALAPGESALRMQNTRLTDTHARLIGHRTGDGRVVVGQCIFGDFDCDCDVDMADIMQVALRWGSQEGDPEYDPKYDVDHDGDIDIVDVALVAAAWGNTCDDESHQLQGRGSRAMLRSAMLSTGLRLEPAMCEATVGEPVTLTVWIGEAIDLGGFEFSLTYDAARLAVRSEGVSLGDFLGSTGRLPSAMGPEIGIEDGVGTISFGAITLGFAPPGPNGSGKLADIVFTPLSRGEPEIAFVSAQVTDTAGHSQESLAMEGATMSIGVGSRGFVPYIER